MKIIQPPDVNVTAPNGSFIFKWNPRFGEMMTERIQRTQRFIDSETMRLMVPYTPMRNGILMESVKLGTVIGSGELRYLSPYARYLYYGEIYGPNIPIYEGSQLVGYFSPKGKKKHPTGRPLKYDTSRHPQAGKLWFERMKADHGAEILEGAAKIAGGVAK
ncbi:MAG: hypothetical protein II514_06270 [Ruminococcus sp.]|nr:hypothetical protein [Ruminococcus sp.]